MQKICTAVLKILRPMHVVNGHRLNLPQPEFDLPRGGLKFLRSTRSIGIALSWSDEVYKSVQSFARNAAVKYLDTALPLQLQSSVAVREICKLVREKFPLLPTYKDDWHIKAILQRFLLTTHRRPRHGRKSSPQGALRRRQPYRAVGDGSPTRISGEPISEKKGTPPREDVVHAAPAPSAHVGVAPQTNVSTIRHAHWLDLPIYQLVSLGQTIWVHFNTSSIRNVVTREAAERMGTRQFESGLPVISFMVDFDGVVEETEALVAETVPYDVDLILGMDWIREHGGFQSWYTGWYCFSARGGNELHSFKRSAATVSTNN
ncbi:hypothetical protein AURDEDRAFT_177609 [Auricularia subglabra TFB-10046 SS5]|uniref:Uncharacterized protein n=1 Tax=Auricularia subglabra (strain TFB-10046 / SS5) TaxID=717982 RepID=J0WLV3_AURST|nr:hypothetical protein AURDEDRAFT_177609 [Auricularia subglabra TFB-10046 SS5]